MLLLSRTPGAEGLKSTIQNLDLPQLATPIWLGSMQLTPSILALCGQRIDPHTPDILKTKTLDHMITISQRFRKMEAGVDKDNCCSGVYLRNHMQ